MRISWTYVILALVSAVPRPALAEHAHDGPTTYHFSRLETDVGVSHGDAVPRWDLDAWYGGDFNKIWIKSEGESTRGTLERAQFWAMYSRNVAMYWDVQAGIRQDTAPGGTSFLTLGLQGLAPYYFETEAHVFLSNRGDLSARLREENDLLITQRLIAQPYIEANFYTQNDPRQNVGAGVAGEVGLQTRYEFTRKFAPYIDLRYEDSFGGSGRAAENAGEYRSSFVASIGLRLMY